MIFGRNARPGIGDAYLHRVGQRVILLASFTRNAGIARAAAFPHVGFRVQPNRSSCRSELRCILQQVGNHPLHLGRVKRKSRQFVVSQKVKRKSLLLKPVRPEAADLGETGIHVPGLVSHLHLAGFEHAEAEEVLDEMLQPLAAGVHIAQHFALAIVEPAQLLTLQQFDVSVKNRQRSLQVMGCGGERVGRTHKPFP